MKNFKTWFPLVLAVVLGLVAMKVARDVISNKEPAANAGPSSEVVVVKRDLAAGAELTSEDLTTAKISGELNPQAVFASTSSVTGRVLITGISKGAPVMDTLLAPSGTGSGLQALIPAGMRAITIEINEFSGVAGNLTSGSKVDVVATINGEGGETTSRTVVQNVRVQSIGMRQAQGENNGAMRSVTLLASPKEAEQIELAAATGKPRLVLRNGNDSDTSSSEGVTLAQLRTGGLFSGGSIDPFETIVPAISAPPVQTAPTTQPQSDQPRTQPVAETRPWRRAGRQVKIIRGGVETEVIVEEVAFPTNSRWTSTPTDELNESSQN